MKTHCKQGHLVKDHAVWVNVKSGLRWECRACATARQRERRARRRETKSKEHV